MVKPYLLYIVFLLYANFSIAQGNYLIPFTDGNKWGYSDTTHHIVIPVKYDHAGFFLAGHAPVIKGASSYLLDKKGKRILSGDFEIDLSPASVVTIRKGEKFGLLDVGEGMVILPPIYKSVYNHRLLVNVRDEKGREGLYHIGLKKWILPFNEQQIYIKDEYILIRKGLEELYFSVSTAGQLMMQKNRLDEPPPQEEMLASSPGRSYQSMMLKSAGGVGFVVKTLEADGGEVISEDSIPAVFESVVPLGLPPLLIVKRDGKQGMIDMKGKIMIPFLYDEIRTRYSGDSIYAVKKEGKWGLTRMDKILLPCEYDEIMVDSIFQNGFYLKQGGKKGFYVYSNTKKLYGYTIPCRYENVLSWMYNVGTDGQVPFYILRVNYNGGKDGFIDIRGNEFFK